MRTAHAIAALRERMGLTQQELADTIGVTVTSISRYANGKEPNRNILKKLAGIAESASLLDLRDVFLAKWKADIISHLKKQPSTGTQRVPIMDLKSWQAAPQFLQEQLQDVRKTYIEVTGKYRLEPSDRKRLEDANRIMFGLEKNFLPQLSNSIEPYLNTHTNPNPKTKEK